MKATAIAPANIAFIKYWGKKDEVLRLPLNSSISMNLSGAYTTTTVEFSDQYREDCVTFLDEKATKEEEARVVAHLDRIRQHAGTTQRVNIVTKNSFPKSSGIASSASGFAALTVAAASALELELSEKELSILARFGSGSACRSIPDGFVLWEAGKSSETSFARSLHPSTWWDLRDIIVIVSREQKETGSSRGMAGLATSPLWPKRRAAIPQRLEQVFIALKQKNLLLLGETIEEDCLDMHAVMQTQKPPLLYWNEMTRKVMTAVRRWKMEGLAVYFTIDAGPNVHLIYEAKDEGKITEKAKAIGGIQEVIVNHPARGTHLIDRHLF